MTRYATVALALCALPLVPGFAPGFGAPRALQRGRFGGRTAATYRQPSFRLKAVADTAEADKLRAKAAQLRAEVAELEAERQGKLDKEKAITFGRLDANADGEVTAAELRTGLEKVGVTLDQSQAERVLAQFDTNKDGVLSVDEMVDIGTFARTLERLVMDERQAARELKLAEAEKRLADAESPNGQAVDVFEGVGDTPLPIRAAATLPYVLPMLDGLRYGSYLFKMVPVLGAIFGLTLGPFMAIYTAIPFGPFIIFYGMSVLSQNPSLPPLVRFNLQQAILLDVALFLPTVIGWLASVGGGGQVSPLLAEPGSDTVWILLLVAVLYSTGSTVLGKLPTGIPLISDIAARVVQGPGGGPPQE